METSTQIENTSTSPRPLSFTNQNFFSQTQSSQNSLNPSLAQQNSQTLHEVPLEGGITSRTRGATLRLSVSLTALPKRTLLQKLSATTVNSTIVVTWGEAPLWREQSFTGRIIACHANGARLIQSGNDTFQIPFDSENKLISKIEVIQKACLSVPVLLSNGALKPQSSTIFLDGGARPNPGPGASAIYIAEASGTIYAHSKYFTFISNNIAEAIAMLAALRKATRLLETTDHVNIVTDSEIVYKIMLGIMVCKDKKLTPIFEQIQQVFMSICGKVTIHTMRRSMGNPADEHCTKAILQAKSFDDQDLFIDPPVLPPTSKIETPVAHKPLVDLESFNGGSFDTPKNLREFAQLRRYKVRTTVPACAIPLWSTVVKFYLMKCEEKTGKEKEEAIIRFIMLPHMFLPANCSSARIMKHLTLCSPFHTSFNSNSETRDPDDDGTSTARRTRNRGRTVETINRLVNDRKMKSANKLLQTMADAEELSFGAKLETLRSKTISQTGLLHQDALPPIPMISGNEVQKALNRMNRQAATAIDGLTKDLLQVAIEHDSEIAVLLGHILHHILSSLHHSPLFLHIILLARGVAIPKPGSQLGRPICISSIITKLCGTIAMMRDSTMPSSFQYAIGTKEGHKRIIHKIREKLRTCPDVEVLRLDVSNAFGTMPRAVVKSQIRQKDPALQHYFRLVYGAPSQIVVLGSEKSEVQFITLGEGIKQGDATSSLFFVIGLDVALNQINFELKAKKIDAEVMAYMDDITILAPNNQMDDAAAIAVNQLKNIGLSTNVEKSKILSGSRAASRGEVQAGLTIPIVSHEQPFVVLGANIAKSHEAAMEYENMYTMKQIKYFDVLKKTELHPQIEFTLLKICGSPRIDYFCSVTEPIHTHKVAGTFDELVKKRVEWLLDPSGETKLSPEDLHSKNTLGIPYYSKFRTDLYAATRHMSLTDMPDPIRVPLLLDTSTSATKQQIDADYLFFNPRTALTPAEFSTALAIRLNVLPNYMKMSLINTKCCCGFIYEEEETTIEHVLTCDQSMHHTHTSRHNGVRDAIALTSRQYGISTVTEPTCFNYDTGFKQRPDILSRTHPFGLVTDVTLIKSVDQFELEEKDKTKTHSTAVGKQSCIFIPFVMCTRGTISSKAELYINTLSKAVLPSLQHHFKRDLRHSISTAAAKGRATSLMMAADKSRW